MPARILNIEQWVQTLFYKSLASFQDACDSDSNASGGVAALNHRLMAWIPPGLIGDGDGFERMKT